MKRYSKNIILLILFPVLLVFISLVIGSSQNIGFGELFHHIALELGMSKDTTLSLIHI